MSNRIFLYYTYYSSMDAVTAVKKFGNKSNEQKVMLKLNKKKAMKLKFAQLTRDHLTKTRKLFP